jgi:uncharacterized sporulation protein YeaH/YhbH (DUF444 family)
MTTHDPRGGGRPRLIFALGDTAPQHASQREFDLLPGVTVIGSAPEADLRLEGLDAHQAEIRRDERDEYLYVDLGSQAPGRVDGQPASSKPLRTGDRIELGGLDAVVLLGRVRRSCHSRRRAAGRRRPASGSARAASTRNVPEGGSDQTADGPGEYF